MDLFAYGTLMFSEVFRAVTGRTFSSYPAELHGFTRYRVKEVSFPGIIADPEGLTDGRLYRGIDANALRLIDAFEGDLYLRQPVTVVVRHDTTIGAEAYVVPVECRELLTSEPWDPITFQHQYLPRFLGSPDSDFDSDST